MHRDSNETVKQYYFDSLPLRFRAERLESFTSYLTRLAEMNGLRSIPALQAVCFPDQSLNVVRNLRDYPLSAMRRLETVATCSEADLLATTWGRNSGVQRYSAHFLLFCHLVSLKIYAIAQFV